MTRSTAHKVGNFLRCANAFLFSVGTPSESTVRQPCEISECLADNEECFKQERQSKQQHEHKKLRLKDLVEHQAKLAKEPKKVAEQEDSAKAIAQQQINCQRMARDLKALQ